MKKYILGLFLVSFVLVPFFSFAQVGDIDPNPDVSQCVSLQSTNLRYKARDINTNGEVSTLQDFLQSQGYLNNEPTGYFGILTVKAVKEFQRANKINPTGYVGSITKAIIENLSCGGVIPNSNSTITVLSPNGGEKWVKNTTQMIKWQDSETYTCKAGEACSSVSKYYDITLNYYNPPCTERVCVSRSSLAPLVIAKKVSGFSYAWDINNKNLYFSRDVLDGLYQIKVCLTGTGVCDSTDNYFKIISSDLNSPVISGVSGPQTLNVNQTGTWKVSAYDKNGGNLSYSVNWGDSREVDCASLDCGMVKSMQVFQQSATFTHSYSQARTYTPTFYVTNNNGKSATTSLTVKVGEKIFTNPITVLSPNGGETFWNGSTQTITWQDNIMSASMMPTYYDISLVPYYGSCLSSSKCSLMVYHAPYSIAQKVSGYSYSWPIVGGTTTGTSYMSIPDGQYTIKICKANSDVCDSSNSYFKIASNI